MRIFYLVSLMFILNLQSHGQLLSGLWKGKSEHSIFLLNPLEVTLEINIVSDTLVTGVISNYYKNGRFDHSKIEGVINWTDSIVSISEVKETGHNITNKLLETCLGHMKLRLTKNSESYRLEGTWKDRDRKIFHCPTLNIWFEKAFPSNAPTANDGITPLQRILDIQRSVKISLDEADSLKLTLYDNAEIDNDTVTVYLNDSMLLKSVRLSDTPVEIVISLDKKKTEHYIKLLADNFGSIPPNTALMILSTKKNRYSITLSSDYQKNASIEIIIVNEMKQ